MYKISKMPLAVDIGYVGETGFRKLEIDMTDWMRLMPDGIPSIVCIRPGETKANAYVAVTTFENNVLTWVITAADIGTQEGEGEIQIWLEEEENSSVIKRGKSVKVKTRVNDAVNDPSPDTPTSEEAFIEQVTALKTAAVNAKTAAETAQGKAEDAQEAAEQAAEDAEAAVVHQPYIDSTSKHWMVWDNETEAYVDTEILAEGHTPVRGTDYWTQQDQTAVVAAAAQATAGEIIDDTAGEGATGKTWSANKLNTEITDVKSDYHGIEAETNHQYKYADLLYYKNLLNNKTWEVGTINSTTGVDTDDSASIRMKESVPISDSVLILQLAGVRNFTLYIYEYGANGYIGRKYWSYTLYGSDIKNISLDANVTSLRFVAYSSGGDYDKNLASISASVCYELREFFNYSTEYVKLNPYHGKSITTVNEEQRTGNVPQSNKQYLYKAGSFTITTDGTGYVGAEMYFLCPAIGSTLNVNATRSAGNQWVTRVLFFDDTFTQIGSQSTSNTSTHQVVVPSGTRFVKITFGCCWGTALAENTQITFSNVEVYYAVADGFDAIETKIGNLTSLDTEDKTSAVNAINEVVARQDKDIRFPTIWMFDVGHQGFYEEAPASSVASFCRAKAHGYNTIECDIRLTSDNEFVICHNDYLPSDTSYKISQHTYAELYENQNLGTYNNVVQKIMKFKEMVQLAKTLDMRLFVELKSTLTQQQIADIIEIANLQGMSERVYWMADVKNTSAQYAGYFRTADPSCNLLINFNRSYSDFANFVIQGHPEKTYCYAWGGYIDDTIIQTFATNGLQMVAWCVSYDYYYPELTTDELIKAEIRRVINCGAIGMCLDKWSLTEVLHEPYESYIE